MKIPISILYSSICIIIMAIASPVFPNDISNSINFVFGIPELFDVKYGIKVSRASFYLRSGIGWYLFYQLNNEDDWEIAPEVSFSYSLLNKGRLEIAPEIGISYIYHDGYYNYLGSSNYFQKSKSDMLFENIRAKIIWNTGKSGLFMAGNVGFSIVEEINQSQIIENTTKSHKTALGRTTIFPVLSFEVGRRF